MGDQIGQAVEGTLYYVPRTEFDRAARLNAEAAERAALFADLCRINALYMIARAGSGHIGSSFSSLDIVSWLMLEEMNHGVRGQPRDIFFSSKGHDAPALYAALIALGHLPFEKLHTLRQLNGLPGHPDVSTGPAIETNTGSLGMGISKAKGIVFANRLLGRPGRVFVMTGDGELQEGQIWESLVSAANGRMEELTVVVDHNKLQSDTLVARTSDLGDLGAKFAAFGWHVERVDGHHIPALRDALKVRASGKPKVIIADTVKGQGVSFMEHTAMESDVALYRFHSGAPDSDSYTRAAQELIERVNGRWAALEAAPLDLQSVERPTRPAALLPQKLIPAYSAALLDQARRNPKLVALDADLILDTGLIPFKDELPERFVECGIAEMDMVSQAGGMALSGLLPVCHSFACFLSTRPNEQIYNNATERTKIIYVGSLAGLVPAGPGHSHQSVRDISALAAVPGLTMVEPSCEEEVAPLLNWCVNEADGSSYIRLVSVPWEIPFALPADYRPQKGRGVVVAEGGDAVLFSYGPVLLSEAWHAQNRLAAESCGVKIVNLPWLNTVDVNWLKETIKGARAIFTLDNHYIAGGQGELLGATLSEAGISVPIFRLGLTEIPSCGTNQEVLRAHELDAEGIYRAVSRVLQES